MILRFPESAIREHAKRYVYSRDESAVIAQLPIVKAKKYLTKRQLRLVVAWKSPRNLARVENSSNAFVKEVTGFAMNTKDPRAQIEALTVLDGVLWPTASSILHFYHSHRYPILDFRALWSVRAKVPKQYDFEFWNIYVKLCRAIAARNHVTMRVLDRALWQYSSENQR